VLISKPCQVLTTVADAGPSGLSKIYAGRIISGLGIGAISAVSPAYVAECSPKDVRGRMTGLFQIMVAIGMMIAYFINCSFFRRVSLCDER
jgi:MFS family permease